MTVLFLDSGAHSLYNQEVYKKRHGVRREDRYAYYETDAFYQYVDQYCSWLKKNPTAMDFYVSVDAIHQPEITWKVQKYIEETHKLSPIPVVHSGTPIRWLRKYLDAGYQYIGLGGVSLEGTGEDYIRWADRIFSEVCVSPLYIPTVKFHGFALSNYPLMIRWPWYSVDSASWAKAAAFGSIFVPHKRGGEFTFATKPYTVALTPESSAKRSMGKHYDNMAPSQRRIVDEWVERLEIPMGRGPQSAIEELGLVNNYRLRGKANVLFFDALSKWLPPWPWAWKAKKVSRGFFT